MAVSPFSSFRSTDKLCFGGMMVASVASLLWFAHFAFGALHGRQVRMKRCGDVDNCAQAVTGTSAYSIVSDVRPSDCSGFMTDTITMGGVV